MNNLECYPKDFQELLAQFKSEKGCFNHQIKVVSGSGSQPWTIHMSRIGTALDSSGQTTNCCCPGSNSCGAAAYYKC